MSVRLTYILFKEDAKIGYLGVTGWLGVKNYTLFRANAALAEEPRVTSWRAGATTSIALFWKQ